jgi:hypothetical protein
LLSQQQDHHYQLAGGCVASFNKLGVGVLWVPDPELIETTLYHQVLEIRSARCMLRIDF